MTTEYVHFCNCDDCSNNDVFEPVDIFEIREGEKLELLEAAIDTKEDKRHGTHICEICLSTIHDDFPNLLVQSDDTRYDLMINPIIANDESVHDVLAGGEDYELIKEIYKRCEVDNE